MVPVEATQLYHYSTKAAADNTEMNEHGWVLIKLLFVDTEI